MLPTRVSVGQPSTAIPVTIYTIEPHAGVTVSLRSVATGRIHATVTITAQDPTTRFTGVLHLAARDITGWGAQEWVVTAASPAAKTTVGVVFRARSLLGVHARRHADTVTVTGAARAYDGRTGRYLAWTGSRVRIQRWTRDGWVTLATVRTNDRGNMQYLLHISFTAGLRLIDTTGATIWWAASRQVIV